MHVETVMSFIWNTSWT